MYRYIGCLVAISLMSSSGFAELTRAYAGPGTQSSYASAPTVTFQAVFFCGIPMCHVTGLDASDFQIGFTGTFSSPRIVSVADSGQWYSVVVETGSGEGDLWLNLRDDDSIVNANQEPLGGPGAGNGDWNGELVPFHIERTPPHVISITPTFTPTAAVQIGYRVVFSEPVIGVDKSDFTTNDVNVCPTYPLGCFPPLSTAPGYWPVALVLQTTPISETEFAVLVGGAKATLLCGSTSSTTVRLLTQQAMRWSAPQAPPMARFMTAAVVRSIGRGRTFP